jgi:iron complex transport system ATP-binding protein
MGGGSFTASGKVRAQGLPEQVLRPALLRSVFQLEAEIHPDPISRRPMCVMK